MSLVGRASLFTFSLGAHAVLGAYLGTIPPAKRHETVAISFTETNKARSLPPQSRPREPDPAPPSAPAQARPRPTPAAPAHAPEASARGGTRRSRRFRTSGSRSRRRRQRRPRRPGRRGPATQRRPASASKTLARTAPSKADDCDEPPAKPKPLSRPTPAYTADARAPGICRQGAGRDHGRRRKVAWSRCASSRALDMASTNRRLLQRAR